MKKEFGKWLMDVVKYVLTAILLATVFGGMEDKALIFIFGLCIVGITLGWGLFLVSDKKDRKCYNYNKPIKNDEQRSFLHIMESFHNSYCNDRWALLYYQGLSYGSSSR